MRPSLNPTINDATFSDGTDWKTVRDDDDEPHVVPRYGRKHELSMKCWCHPVLDLEYHEPAISHNLAH